MKERSRKSRQVAVSVAACLAVVLFAVLGGSGWAQTAIGGAQEPQATEVAEVTEVTEVQAQDVQLPAQAQAGKVSVCHKGKKAISISANALPAHVRHGDAEGACALTTASPTTKGKNEENQSSESSELPTQEKVKPAKGKPAWAGNGASAQPSERPAKSFKPKKDKAAKTKGGLASPPGLAGASPPGHSQGNGKNK